jgi:hypothetical protein
MGSSEASESSVARPFPVAPLVALAACLGAALAWAVVGAGGRPSPSEPRAEARQHTDPHVRADVPEDVARLDEVDWAAGAALYRDLASFVRDGTPCLDLARIEDPASAVVARWSRFLEDLAPFGGMLGHGSPHTALDHPAVHERLAVAAVRSLLGAGEAGPQLSQSGWGQVCGPLGSQEAHDRGVDAAIARRILAAVPEGRRTEAAALLLPIFLGVSREVALAQSAVGPDDALARIVELVGRRKGPARTPTPHESTPLRAWALAGHEVLADLVRAHGEAAVRGALASASDPDVLTLRLDLRARMATLFVRYATGEEVTSYVADPSREAGLRGAVWIVGWM